MPLNYQERRIYHWHEELDRRIGVERIPPQLRVQPRLEPLLGELSCDGVPSAAILSCGAYVPRLRLPREPIRRGDGMASAPNVRCRFAGAARGVQLGRGCAHARRRRPRASACVGDTRRRRQRGDASLPPRCPSSTAATRRCLPPRSILPDIGQTAD